MFSQQVYYDIAPASLNRQGEVLCGDQVKIHRTPEKTIVVLSDGLGSGVKACILARLTAEILVTMLREHAGLQDVIETIIRTLPICRTRKIAYATFVILEIDQATGAFRVINFDSPPVFYLCRGRLQRLQQREEEILGKRLRFSSGRLERGDLLGAISDGVLFAGPGAIMNTGWGWDQVGAHLESLARHFPASASTIASRLMGKTQSLYGGEAGDDATFVSILARSPKRLLILTGPPSDEKKDEAFVNRMLDFDGRRVVCGGTTADIVAANTGEKITMDMSTRRDDVPPISMLQGADLVTEGILTLAKTLQLLHESEGNISLIPMDRNGASLLAREMLTADAIHFLAGESINPYYQNPLLPRNISIRHNLLEQLSGLLRSFHKEVSVEWW